MARPPRRNAETALASAWQQIWATPQGKLALGELMVATNVYSEIIATDPVQLALAIGERNVGARIARAVGLTPQTYLNDAREITDLVGRFIDAHDQN